MDYATQLWLFFALVFAVVILPGLDMAFVLASALTGGRRSGLAAVAGLVAAGGCHVLAGALGIGMLMKVMPAAFNAVLLVGAVYVAWIGWSLLRSRGGFGAVDDIASRSLWATFRQAALTNLLNPKAYMFMLAVFPQFLRTEFGAIAPQAVVLGVIIAATQAGVYGAIALVAADARGWLQSRPAAGLVVNRGVGVVLIAAAAITGLQGWRML
ncbi:LysE family translocator [Montanilutibacter psychrotolerans]|uniref:LysE family translocator n=1 Tax=Montanilutibacter psychrotolerans TaxID=1327343 RepID=A0A3M8SPE9_9GAMM|nr:LysE family translocator [Lysobacter psychrotolerans]RNF82653.1 LysE family translocator [Lysobacter psychrotolerans]